MIKKIKSFMLLSATLLFFGAPTLVPVVAAAACDDGNIQTNLGTGIDDATGNGSGGSACSDATSGTSALQKVASKVVTTFSIVVGIVSVLFVIYGGFRYITSGGDSGSVGNAKNTLIYALVGLVIVALAQLIVHYVLSTANNATT